MMIPVSMFWHFFVKAIAWGVSRYLFKFVEWLFRGIARAITGKPQASRLRYMKGGNQYSPA